MRLMSKNYRTFLNLSLQLIQAYFPSSQFVTICLRDENLVPKHKNSQFDKTKCKLESFSRQFLVRRIKIDFFNVEGFCDHCKALFMQWEGFVISVLAMNFALIEVSGCRERKQID